LRLLLQRSNADVNARGTLDRTPLHYAVGFGRCSPPASIVSLLVKSVADVDQRSISGYTPLMMWAKRDEMGFPVELAKHQENPTACLLWLIPAGADLVAVDIQGRNAVY
jgi:ankyrin repeat protein